MAKTIAIFSTKGGVGKTLVATNLAVSLGYYSRAKVAVIDLDLQAIGDMAKFLNVTAAKSLLDLSESIKKDPGTVVKKFMVHVDRYSLDFLQAVFSPRQAVHVDVERITTVLQRLDKEYDYIVVDAGRAFTESLFTVFNYANLILLVATPDVLSVYQTKWSLDVLQSLRIPLKMVKIVLNRAQSLGGVSWQEVRAAVPCDIISRIPSEGKAVGLALNSGVPVIVDSPNCKVSLAIKKLNKDLVEGKDIFVAHHEISFDSLKEDPLISAEGSFWKKFKLTEEPFSNSVERETDEITELKKRVHAKLIDKLDLKHLEIDSSNPEKVKQVKEKTETVISNLLGEETGVLVSSFEIRKRLVKEITDEALGLGPLEDLINDPEVSDIMVNNKNQIYIERFGKIELSPKRFISDEQVRQVIERIIAPLGRHIDESIPMVDARLRDGSRVNAIIPPLTLSGPTLTIRKFGRERLDMDDLLRINSLNEPMRDLISATVKVRKNIVVSGGTGSGKTTVLNVLSAFIPENERIVTIEDAAELKLKQEHWVRMESRPPNIEGRGAITIRDLFRNTLRMRPDRIIIGECRSAESLDMLQAMNTGHDGSLTTIHANSTHDVLSRLDSMILMSGIDLPVRSIREMIASAIDIIIHTARLSDGSRKIIQISEITGMRDEMHIDFQDIFLFRQTGTDAQGKVIGNFQATGYVPSFIDEIKTKGISLTENIFRTV